MTAPEPQRRLYSLAIGAAVLGVLLSACASTADIRAADSGRCRSYGFRPGTDAYSQCLLDIDLNREAERRAYLNRPYVGFGYGVGYGFGPRRMFW